MAIFSGAGPPYWRHLGFGGRFRFVDDEWMLEIVPTYRFTSDGRYKYRFHENLLKGIKRLEKNRAVLSQVLLWSHLLATEPKKPSYPRLLHFGRIPQFEVSIDGFEAAQKRLKEGA